MRLLSFVLAAMTITVPHLALAEGQTARIADVHVKRDSPDQSGIYHIMVTIEHEDTGWNDYIEAWEVVGPDGKLIATRPFFEPELELSLIHI